MKIWYDKKSLDLQEFKSEKFIFLPQYSKDIVDSDKDFINNDWAERIEEAFTFTDKKEEAKAFIYHDKLGFGSFSKFLSQVQPYIHYIPVLAFFNDDNDTPISDNLPNGVYVFRTSVNKSKQKLNEYSLPAWSRDFGQAPLRGKEDKTISFCGALTHPVRKQCIDKLNSNDEIKTNFLIRDQFWGGKPHDKNIREEYIENLKSCDFVLCARGAGNFSYRLYETLSVGRIPVIIDTDTSLPCSNLIDWDRFIITTPENINKDINNWWKKTSETEYKNCQQYSRLIYEKFINPAGFAENLANGNLFRSHVQSSGMGLYDLLKDKQTIKGVEIGCFEGVNAEFLLESLPQLRLYGIDPYDAYIDWNGLDIDYEDKAKHKDIKYKAQQVFDKFKDRFILHQQTSDKAVSNYVDNSLDFVFVDGLHTYEQTLADCRAYLPKVKTGGIICGHDYGIIDGVTKAVDEFSSDNNKIIRDLKSTTRAWYWIKD